jgi:transglutaminase-like putative cysteine protease
MLGDVGSSPNATRLYHSTTYRFDRSVALGPHLVRLRPTPDADWRVRDYSLRVAPVPHSVSWQQDPHGNWVARVLFDQRDIGTEPPG